MKFVEVFTCYLLVPVAYVKATSQACTTTLGEYHALSGPATVVVDQGTLIGTATIVADVAPTVNKFLGVAFAISPPNRFEPPQPVPASSNTFKASQWSPKCVEDSVPGPLVDTAPESEDCLYLNVYVPDTPTKNKSVMFWIYGGRLQFGNAGQAAYDGSFFAAYEDVIMVSANYRTNVFGFSNSPDIHPSLTNVGFLDQRLALSWVQKNIAAFGGDPEKVTIFGESSGASSVDRLLTSPPLPLPYRAAILQSGQASVSPASPGDGKSSWKKLVHVLGCDKAESQLKCVQAADVTDIKKAVQGNSLPFPPINDGVTQKATPLIAYRASGAAANVPLLVGSNGLEASLFVQPIVEEYHASKNLTAVGSFLSKALGEGTARLILNGISNASAKITSLFFFALSYTVTDVLYTCPVAKVTRASAAAGSPTWRYLFNATFPNTQALLALPQYGLDNIGAYHASEIPIVFGTFHIYDKYAPSTAEQIALSRNLLHTWANFAKNPEAGPGWAPVADSSRAAVGCLGCVQNPEGVHQISSRDIDRGCLLLNLLYFVDKPFF